MGLLSELPVVVVDCQTSGSRAGDDHVIELGWARAPGGAVSASLVALPDGEKLPRRIERMVGVDNAALSRAPDACSVFARFEADLADAAALVAHVARFERPFLAALAARCERPFEHELVCTHALAVRLLPALPRRGLRAVAGYLGYALDCELKRAAAHVEATQHVWRELVSRLEDEHGVTTLEGLRDFVARTKARPTGRHTPLQRERRLALPDAPGVYELLGARGEVLYVGKATSLKARVNSYFRTRKLSGGGGREQRVAELLCQVHDVRVHETPSALEAALHECELIRAHRPPYNVHLRAGDDETVAEVKVLGETVAPLSSPRSAERLQRVLGALEGDLDATLALLWRRDADEATRAIVREALQQLVERHVHPSVPAAVCLLRAVRPLDAPARGDDAGDADADAPAAGDDDDLPTVEGVLEALEEAMQTAARQWRRARWIASLEQARLTFRDPKRDVERTLELGEPCSDRAAYDRLSVLTAELKRLAASGATLALHTAERRYDARALARRLRWV
ncbi:MAG: hypothetical protein KC503_25650 [Myxococcales bacterium]|nr:hypothetical protein [Myxococcales bacterium]